MKAYPFGFTRQHEAAERVSMRHWLRKQGIQPIMGQEPSHTERLMKQVLAAGGDPEALMAKGREKVDREKACQSVCYCGRAGIETCDYCSGLRDPLLELMNADNEIG
jgi:hypothetical protein